LTNKDGPKLADHSALGPWASSFSQLSLVPDVYVKASCLLAQSDPELVRSAYEDYCCSRGGDDGRPSLFLAGTAAVQLRKRARAFLEPVLDSFGTERVLFGSDWPPVFDSTTTAAAATPVDEDARKFQFSYSFALATFCDLGLEGEALDDIFAKNATRAYNLY
jgi:predicted TIM-barrel fold metal-dependent hydrolase